MYKTRFIDLPRSLIGKREIATHAQVATSAAVNCAVKTNKMTYIEIIVQVHNANYFCILITNYLLLLLVLLLLMMLIIMIVIYMNVLLVVTVVRE